MGVPSFFGEPRMPILSRLLAEIRDGEILIPRFERPFVWTNEQRLALLESVYRGYPIGAILVWRTQQHQLSTHEHLGPLLLPEGDKKTGVRQYLIDGHQRLTTLFSALGEGLYTATEAEPKRVGAGQPGSERNWPIYFDLDFDSEEPTDPARLAFPFRLLRRGSSAAPTWLPLSILFDAYEVQEVFTARLPKEKRTKKIINRIRTIAETFSNYPIPVMPIATEDIDQVTTSFKRINSGGRKMTEVHMVSALSYGADFDLLERIESLRASLKPLGWQQLNTEMVLNVCKARLGQPIYDARPEALASAIKKDPALLDGVREDIERAARTLDRIAYVRGPAVLPYNYQLVLMADALRNVASIDDNLASHLRTWFWATTLGEYFRGISKSAFERAQMHLRTVVSGTTGPLPPDIDRTVYSFDGFDFRAARSRAMALLLAEQLPTGASGGESDAFTLLAVRGADALSRLVMKAQVSDSEEDRSAIDGPENRFLIHPSQSGLLVAWTEPLFTMPASVLRSHAVSEEAEAALRTGRYSEFLQLRRKTLEQMERSRVEEVGLTYRTGDQPEA